MGAEMIGIGHRQVGTLNEIGRTFKFKGVEVVPSQAYAQFCGKHTKEVNRALKRISAAGRLVSGEDFFTLNVEESAHLARCQPGTFQSNHGLTLLSRLAVNTLSHHFDDANSVAHSNRVNSIATESMDHGSGDAIPTYEMIGMLAARGAALEKRVAVHGVQLNDLTSKVVQLEGRMTTEKINVFPAGCETVDRIAEFFPGMSKAVLGRWLNTTGHPTREYKHMTSDGEVRISLVYVKSGIEQSRDRLVNESRFLKTTALNQKYYHSLLGNFQIKRISHMKSFMGDLCDQ